MSHKSNTKADGRCPLVPSVPTAGLSRCSDWRPDEDSAHEHGRGHAHSHGCGHAHGHSVPLCAEHRAEHSKSPLHGPADLPSCGDEECCPAFNTAGLPEGMTPAKMRLNSHCNFNGHCVQLRNTFLHIPCHDSDSETDCVVCRFTRSRARSCDDVRA